MERITLSPPILNCGNCSLLQISTKLHLGCSCGWYLQPTLDFNYSYPGFIPIPRASWECGCKAGPHTWACFGTQSLLAQQTQLPWVFNGRRCPQQSVPSPLSNLVLTTCLLVLLGVGVEGGGDVLFFLVQGWKEDSALCWILTQLGIPAQKFTITPKSRKKCHLIELKRASLMMECPASSSHLTSLPYLRSYLW